MALADLQAKLRAAKAKAATTITADKASGIDTASKPKNLDNMTLRIAEQKSKVELHMERQEEKGTYKFADELHSISGFDATAFIDSMKALDEALVEDTPQIRTLSTAIRRNLQQFPELTHILTDDQLAILVGGMLKIANVETAPKTKSKGTTSKALDASMDLSDFG